MHGDPTLGYEVIPINIAYTCKGLKLNCEEWDYNATKPQATAYKKWLKAHLVQGHPVIWFPMCKGDHGDGCYGPNKEGCPNGGRLDHVEPIYGIFSNHSLNDTRVYDDDWIVHASDQDRKPYYRAFSTLEDTPAMEGNCRDAQAFPGRNEMYPCFDSIVTYGAAVMGLAVQQGTTLPLALEARDSNQNVIREPNVRLWPHWLHSSVLLHGTVRITGLVSGETYVLYRYNSTASLPSRPPFDRTAARIKEFVAPDVEWLYLDPEPFESHSTTYYIATKKVT